MRIAFDLDDTLGSAFFQEDSLALGFQLRYGCREFLAELANEHQLLLWTASNRAYMEKALQFGKIGDFFAETYAWEDFPDRWKDVRKIAADYLVDDCEEYRKMAREHGIEAHYVIVPAYGSSIDRGAPQLWQEIVRSSILQKD